ILFQMIDFKNTHGMQLMRVMNWNEKSYKLLISLKVGKMFQIMSLFFCKFAANSPEMLKGRNVLISCMLVVIPILFSSWGFLVHRTVNQLAVYELPKELRGFFIEHMEYIVRNAPRPDIRRNQDSTEASKHFIDLEMYGDSSAWKMPMQWDA